MNGDYLFEIVFKECNSTPRTNGDGESYFDLIQKDLNNFGFDHIFYLVDTFDLYNYINPFYFYSFVKDDSKIESLGYSYYFPRATAYSLVFDKIFSFKSMCFVVPEEYFLEFYGLNGQILNEEGYFDRYQDKINSKIIDIIEGVEKDKYISTKNRNLLFQYLEIADENGEGVNLKERRNRKYVELFKKIKLGLGNTELSNKVSVAFENNVKDSMSSRFLEAFAEKTKYKMLGKSKEIKYKFLKSSLNDIKVIQKIININQGLKNSGRNSSEQFVLRYFSSSPYKTDDILEIIKNLNINTDPDFSVKRNVFHLFFIYNILYRVKEVYHDISPMELVEIGKGILSPITLGSKRNKGGILKLRDSILHEIDDRLVEFFSNHQELMLKLEGIKADGKAKLHISRSFNVSYEGQPKYKEKVYRSANILRYIDYVKEKLRPAKRVQGMRKEIDPIKNDQHSLPNLLFLNEEESRKNLPSVYLLFNYLSDQTEAEVPFETFVELINKIASEISKIDSPKKNDQINYIKIIVVCFFVILVEEFSNEDEVISVAHLVEDLKAERAIIPNLTSEIDSNSIKNKQLEIINHVSLATREIDYFLLWIERKDGLFDDKKSILKLVERADAMVKLYSEDGRFYHGRALILIKLLESYNKDGVVGSEQILECVDRIFYDFEVAINYYSIINKKNFNTKDQIVFVNLLNKNISAIKNSILYLKLFKTVKFEKTSEEQIGNLRKDLDELKVFCFSSNIDYEHNSSFNHTEYSIEFQELEIYYLTKRYNVLRSKLFNCWNRYKNYKRLRVVSYFDYEEVFPNHRVISRLNDLILFFKNFKHIDSKDIINQALILKKELE